MSHEETIRAEVRLLDINGLEVRYPGYKRVQADFVRKGDWYITLEDLMFPECGDGSAIVAGVVVCRVDTAEVLGASSLPETLQVHNGIAPGFLSGNLSARPE